MVAIDIEALRGRIAQRDASRQAAAEWCAQALREFATAVNALGTPTRGNPDFLKHVYGDQARRGVWPILRAESADNILIEIGHGASITGAGTFWLGGKESTIEDTAWWIAAHCGYSVDVARAAIEDSLMGDSWSTGQALRAWTKSQS